MKIFIPLLLLYFPFKITAQTETEIKKHYQEVNQQIKESKEHGMEGSLYCNELVTNKNSMSWPAVGIYKKTTDFWYNDDPNHISIQERNPKTVLVKITISRSSSSVITNEEYLYKEGRLVFYFSDERQEARELETRIYFNAKGMFKSSVKANGKELTAKELAAEEYQYFTKPGATVILASSKKYQDLFVKQMVY